LIIECLFFSTHLLAGPPQGVQWKPIPEFSDEFNGNKLDTTKWYDHNPTWLGREPGYFNPKNVVVSNGKLHLYAKAENIPGLPEGFHDFTTVAVRSKNTVLYGYFEMKFKPMKSRASSAFWFYQQEPGAGFVTNIYWWTEIDVFEIGGVGKRSNTYYMTAHIWNTVNTNKHWRRSGKWYSPHKLVDGEHIAALEWDENEIKWFYDGKLLYKTENIAWHQPLTMNFDSEIFADWFGIPNKTNLPSVFTIDYIRSYKKNEKTEPISEIDLQVKNWKWKPPESKPFPILAWFGPKAEQISDSTWADMDEAGFNLCLSPFNKIQLNQKTIQLGKKYGIGCFLKEYRLNEKKLKDVVQRWSNEKSLAGYYLKDEPKTTDFTHLAKINREFEKLDSNHWLYVNLFPDYACDAALGTNSYSAYVNSFIKIFKPKVLSFDYYCITTNGIRKSYFKNLGIIREASLKNNIPFWAFTLATPHWGYPKPTEGHIRFQLFSNLAYGAKGLQYFTYCNALNSIGLIDEKGNRTETYEIAKKVNHEIHGLAPQLLKLKSTAVFHTAPAPEGTKLFNSYGGVVLCTNSPAILGFFESPEKETYFMVVNRNPFDKAEILLHFDKKVESLYEADRFKKKCPLIPVQIDNHKLEIKLLPGNARLFRIGETH